MLFFTVFKDFKLKDVDFVVVGDYEVDTAFVGVVFSFDFKAKTLEEGIDNTCVVAFELVEVIFLFF